MVETPLNSEDMALRMTLRLDEVTHSRLNFWLITEGVMFAAAGAIWTTVQDADSAGVLFLLSYVGLVLTVFWQMLTLRAWTWHNWYYKRFSTANRRRCPGEDCLVPPDKHWSLWKGHGLGLRVGSVIMALIFVAIWMAFGYYAYLSWVTPSLMSQLAFCAASGALFIAVFGVLAIPLFVNEDGKEGR